MKIRTISEENMIGYHEEYVICDYDHFLSKRKKLKKLVSDMNRVELRAYRDYIYANSVINNFKKDRIWEYLMDIQQEADLHYDLIKYNAKMNKLRVKN
jgi:hypothetical protein